VTAHPKKKLIEVGLPLDAVNKEALREKSIRRGHPSTLHLWWARRPLAACRAVLFAQLVDDPSADPHRFPTQQKQDAERERLFKIIRRLVLWENTTNEEVLQEARAEIRRCNPNLPTILDPFAGGGSIPLEAQRLGLPVIAADLNPVAALINRAMIELPPKFANQRPIHPSDTGTLDLDVRGPVRGLVEDVAWYGRWMNQQAEARVGNLYPPAKTTSGPATVIAWIWAHTVTCPNPACRSTMPLVNSFSLSKKRDLEAWISPTPKPSDKRVDFEVKAGPGCPSGGTVTRSGATCLACGSAVSLVYVRAEGKEGRMGRQLVCTIAEGDRRRLFLSAQADQVEAAQVERPHDVPTTELAHNPRAMTTTNYGITEHWQLFTDRQLVLLNTFTDLVNEARRKVIADGGSEAYADAVATYLGLSIGRLANRSSSQSFWNPNRDTVEQVFARNALPMMWVYAEGNPFSNSSGNYLGQLDYLVDALSTVPAKGKGHAEVADAANPPPRPPVVIATDPPYYDNLPYADLSDFFYVWLRRCLRTVHPDLFATLLVPKDQELIAEPARQGSWDAAAAFFEKGLQRAFESFRVASVPGIPFTLFYAFKQAETEDGSTASTGWETMLQGLLNAGCMVTGTWPIRTEQAGGLREHGRNSLASSIVLVCRPRAIDAGTTDRTGFLAELRRDLPGAVTEMQREGIAAVDLAQSAIGPGVAVFSRHDRVLEADGTPMRVRSALELINQVLDEILDEQVGDVDADTRWAIAWFDEYGFGAGPYGRAETLSKAKNASIDGLARAGVIKQTPGRVRLLRRDELPADYDPATDRRPTVWEATQHLVRALERGGQPSAAVLFARLGDSADGALQLAYRLYAIADRRQRADEAGAYNALVASWSEIQRLAQSLPTETLPGI
jgi:putative DNA methylase